MVKLIGNVIHADTGKAAAPWKKAIQVNSGIENQKIIDTAMSLLATIRQGFVQFIVHCSPRIVTGHGQGPLYRSGSE